ncbi:MAG: hypothetical protein JAY68_18880 [Candidatus Thiodiazotropha taylori]|nr:hypothetical protein [Candidatus Thiodiazotropha taylori]
MKLAPVGPLGEPFRDEVRKLGIVLELPNEMFSRNPFPGHGAWFGIS